MKKSIATNVGQCNICRRVKIEHQRPSGGLQPLEILKWKWEHITMDFVTELPINPKGNNAIWVIVDRLTKFVHFLAMKVSQPINNLTQQYVNEIIGLYGVPVSVVSNRDPRFTSRFIF